MHKPPLPRSPSAWKNGTALARLSSRLSHRLNNILAVIVGNACYLRELNALSQDMTDALADLEAASHAAIELAKYLQHYAGHAALDFQTVNLKELVERGVGCARDVFHDIAFHTAFSDEACVVRLDAGQAMQAFEELASNAHAANSRNMWVDLSVRAEENERHALLRIRDDGHGMSCAILESATEPMFTTKPGGAGWGLSLLAGLVRQSGGKMEIASSPGRGTQIDIYLPVLG